MSDSNNRRGLWIGLGVVVLAALLVWFWSRGGTSSPLTQRAADRVEPAPSSGPVSSNPAPPRLPEGKVPPAQQGGEPEAPIIDEIIVEKPEVCAGEENLITVKAHTPGHRDDAYLKYLIGSETGMQVPVRSYPPDPEAVDEPPRQIAVFGRNRVATRVDMPEFVVKDCAPERILYLRHGLMSNTIDEYEFWAKIVDVAAEKPLQPPITFHWDFGDGKSADTEVPIVHHSYEDRSFDTLVSEFLVTCTATDRKGEKVVGRRSVQLENDSFEQMAFKGIIMIRTVNTPRFPTLDDHGKVIQKIRLWHNYDHPVTIEKVLRVRYPEHGERPGPPEDVSVAGFLGQSVLRPGEKIEIQGEFDTLEHEGISYVTYRLLGTSSDGWPAQGELSLMKPPELPTREHNIPVADPLFAAKILKARELLGKEFVSQEEIFELERQGQFEGLEPVGNLQVSEEPPERR